MATTATKTRKPLGTVRATVIRMRKDGERMVGRVRRDAEALIARSRREFLKDVRDLERRLLQSLHGATAERVARLERRIEKLEEAIVRPGPGA
jgi:hypothetical protein